VSSGSLKIVPTDSLKPERNVSFEIGGSQWLGERVFLDLALFQSDYYDLIEALVYPDYDIRFTNITRARIRGLEVGMKTDWFDRLISTDFSYTYTDPVDLRDNSVLKFRSRHLFYASLSANYRQWRTEINFRYVSRVEAIDEALVNLAPIIDGDQRVACKVVDAGVTYNLINTGLPITFGLTVKNLTNYYYVELIGNLAPVRTYYVSVEGVW
jgi:outer membrane receptor protein involved in Fe transport